MTDVAWIKKVVAESFDQEEYFNTFRANNVHGQRVAQVLGADVGSDYERFVKGAEEFEAKA